MSEILQIRTLGSLSIQFNSKPIAHFETRKMEALLVYLAYTGQSQSREFLGELLWNDRSQKQSLANIRLLLHRLRPSVDLLTRRRTVSLAQGCWVDARELSVRMAGAEAQWSQQGTFSPDTVASLEYALSLYQGDFLAGFYIADARNFDEWMFFEREQLRLRVLNVTDCLAQTYLANGATLDGVRQAQRLLQLDPLQEKAHRHLIHLYMQAGQTSAALAQYETCRRLLAEELEVEPSDETQTLYTEIAQNAERPKRDKRVQKTSTIPLTDARDAVMAGYTAQLPVQNTPFIGREPELAELAALLADPTQRLISIVGAGGMGKTRLALEAVAQQANRFVNGVHFVALAPLTSPDFVQSALAEVIGVECYQGLDPHQQLLDYFREKSLLLLIDNFEHVLEAATLVSDILHAAPGVKIVITSRERLNIEGERLFQIEGMDYPDWDIPHNTLSYSAVKLFFQSAQRIDPLFAMQADDLLYLVQICKQLAGMPLGIVLAASWVGMLSLAEISQELARDVDFLENQQRDAPVRHRSIRNLFGYSWGLLTEEERRVYARLSVFRGGFTREAAQEVTGASLHVLRGLVNKSMLRRDPAGRYDFHELLRQYAAGELAHYDDKEREAQEAHCLYYAKFIAAREARLYGPDQTQAMAELDMERANVEIAWLFAVTHRFEHELRLMTLDLMYYIQFRGIDGLALFEQARARLAEDTIQDGQDLSHAMVWLALGQTYQAAYKSAYALPLLQQSLAILRQCDYPRATAKALEFSAFTLYMVRESDPSILELFHESVALYKTLGNPAETSIAFQQLAWILRAMNKVADLREALLEGLALSRQSGAPDRIITFLALLGNLEANTGQFAQSDEAFQEIFRLLPALDSRTTRATVFHLWGGAAYAHGNFTEAEARWLEALKLYQEGGYRFNEAEMQGNIAVAQYEQAKFSESRQRLLEVVAFYRESGRHGLANALNNLGHPTAALGYYTEAENYFREALMLAMQTESLSGIMEAIIGLADLLHQRGQTEQAVEWLTMVKEHPRVHQALRGLIQKVVARLQKELPPEVFAAAQQRGRALDLDKLTTTLLDGKTFS